MSAPLPPRYRSFSTSFGIHGSAGGAFPTQPVRPIAATARAQLEALLGEKRKALLDLICEDTLKIGAQWIVDRYRMPAREVVKSLSDAVDALAQTSEAARIAHGLNPKKKDTDPDSEWVGMCLSLLFELASPETWEDLSRRVTATQEVIRDSLADMRLPSPDEVFLDKLIDSWEASRDVDGVAYVRKKASKEAEEVPAPVYIFFCLLLESIELPQPVSLFRTSRDPEPRWRDFVSTFVNRKLWSRTLERRAKKRTRAKKGTGPRLPSLCREDDQLDKKAASR